MINMRRTLLVARRDYLGYIKTWGFWISFFLPFVFGIFGYVMGQVDINVEPVRYEAILDDTGMHGQDITRRHQEAIDEEKTQIVTAVAKLTLSSSQLENYNQVLEEQGIEAATEYLLQIVPGIESRLKFPKDRVVIVSPPADTMAQLQPYLKGEQMLDVSGQSVALDGVMHIYEGEGGLKSDYWSENINSNYMRNLAKEHFNARATRNYLISGGLTPEGLSAAQSSNVKISSFDPTKSVGNGSDSQAVMPEDRIPYVVAAVMAVILWLTVFSGSYMLLTSMLEEKLNKLMEMMLASTRFSEIIFGKLIGVAALTLTAMMPYFLIGVFAVIFVVFTQDASTAAGVTKAFSFKMLVFFPVFLVLGYVFYGAFFIALGALAESMQDAQTLTTPIMLVLTACIMVVPISFNAPDSPLLSFATWFPLSAPFAAIVRLPTDPSWLELSMSALFLALCSVGVIWIAGRVFRFGILSGAGVKSIKAWFARVVLRRKTA